jgi:hypothetical protein
MLISVTVITGQGRGDTKNRGFPKGNPLQKEPYND